MGKLLKGCLIFLGGVIVVLLVVAGLAYYILTRPSPAVKELVPLAPGATPTPTPAPEVIAERAAALETKLETVAKQIEEAEKGTQPQFIRLEITEEEVNALIIQELPRLKEEMKGSPLTITSAQVAFRDGKLKAVAQAEFGALKPSIYLEAQIVLEAGKPKVVVEKLDLGRLPLPGAVKDQLNKVVQDAVRQATEGDIPMDIQRLTIEEGKLVVEGVVIPASQSAAATPPPSPTPAAGITPTPLPAVSPSPTPAATAAPGATPTPATTAAPGATPTPTRAASPTPTPAASPTPTPTPKPVTYELGPEAVADALAFGLEALRLKEPSLQQLQIGTIQVDLSRGRIDARVPVTALGQTFLVLLVTNVSVAEGKAKLIVESVDARALPPSPLRTQVEDFLRRGATGVALDVGFRVTEATIQGGKVVLKGFQP